MDTIAAIATGGALSAIGIIRISGPDAITAAGSIFRAESGVSLTQSYPRRLHYGRLFDTDGEVIDLCVAWISRAPKSYTGEDTAEFQCHGSPIVLAEVLRALFALGVRQAQPGEFTKRAFLNGRMDLTQAEAVIDLIEAETPSAARNAAGQLQGAVGIKLDAVYNALVDIMAHFHAVIDYPDEDIDEFELENYLTTLRDIEQQLSQMLLSHEHGRVLRDGLPTAIIGRPNVGKSSLLNTLLGYDRAIVTDIPGTTRDTIEEKILLGGVLLRMIDTAGIRKTDDAIEKMGVERTLDTLSRAKLALLVLDGSQPLKYEDFDALRSIPADMPKLAIVNKSDLPHAVSESDLDELDLNYCHISTVTGNGLDELETRLKQLLPQFSSATGGALITNARQADAISRAKTCVCAAISAMNDSVTPDAVLTEIESAAASIGEVTGTIMREDIVGRIFERFCIGK